MLASDPPHEMKIGQLHNVANHRFTTTVQRHICGHATNVAIRPLDEVKAVQVAADLIGELFVFTEMKQKDEEIAREVEVLKQKLEELEQLVKERGLAGFFNFRHGHVLKDEKNLLICFHEETDVKVYIVIQRFPRRAAGRSFMYNIASLPIILRMK
ncbi:hypothetical protein GH714_031196 [Hevea brasiliensis]|uniref:Uncharacterized protein n=1 Tax=Hevea brasiliensis TaxID=3981 RepID=A0A6A6L124_HEVBR|nr:hypothetical protein GH714_031196 [Hevea brasiliensis]